MAKEEFEIELDRDGKVTIKTIGIKGPRCVDAAEALAMLIGREEARQLTGEYYEVDQEVSGQVDIRQQY
jgi:hypothetical protein